MTICSGVSSNLSASDMLNMCTHIHELADYVQIRYLLDTHVS